MRIKGLLHKAKFQVLIILVLCIQMVGPKQLLTISSVKSEGLPGTEPKITITSPVTNYYSNGTNLSISGTVENFPVDSSITLYEGTDPKGTSVVTENNWTIPVILSEGIHTITAQSDVDGVRITSNPIKITVDSTLPSINFVKPSNGEYINSRLMEGATEPSAIVKICMDCMEEPAGAVIGNWVSATADSTGKWVYENPLLSDGTHIVYAKATDQEGNNGDTNKITFVLDTLRPKISPDVFPKQDMTQVPLNSIIKVKINDASAMDGRQEVIDKSIQLYDGDIKVEGTAYYNAATKEITFTPLKALDPSTKYNVIISPFGIVDAAANSAFPRFWSFTTVGAVSDVHQNPHGIYTNNVNTCGNCHSTHKAKDPGLLSTPTTTSTEATTQTVANQEVNLAADNYCMACHDGTVAPLPENRLNEHTHNAAVKIDGQPSGSSCSSCHNPHLDWSEKNSNLAQDHIIYKHLPSNPIDPNKPTEEISSKEQLCESCHEHDSAEKIANPAVEYRVFQYSKSSTATGLYEDYELCLRCHNGDFKKKYSKIADIASHYNNLTEDSKKQYENINGQSSFSNRDITIEKGFSGHIMKAQDGSPLAGHIPCAECHDTHGSNNIKQLKHSIGHEGIQSFTAGITDFKVVKDIIDSKEQEFTILTDAKEREFCLACHNGTTAIYGGIGQKYDETINEHKSFPSKPCSYCHGRGASEVERALSASHAPKQGLVPVE